MDLESFLGRYIDPKLMRAVLDFMGIDLKKLTPPHFSDANFSDMNQMIVHYFVIFYPMFLAGIFLYALA